MTAAIGLVWAQARGGVIGAAGGMPWHVPEDLAHFREVTADAPVVMGRRTWDSLPERFRPLPGRRNFVVTRSAQWSAPGAQRAGSLDEALADAGDAGVDRIWLIGGGKLFREGIARADLLEVTELDVDVEGDTFAPPTPGWMPVTADPPVGWRTSRTGIPYRFLTLRRAARDEPEESAW
ncbi:dihydrofolate reductase [Microbacterium hominis]|uniref:Dihydrofolate reductase n=1 Tax=Microbacterium hominis TaxID=162426 RepID=A0A7D4Q1G4_9MICO|nr:dihydrofolate reductase [Microbacterium hominis]QKJ19812.1 dihydrofolate reductase [Microbacterium hominis]